MTESSNGQIGPGLRWAPEGEVKSLTEPSPPDFIDELGRLCFSRERLLTYASQLPAHAIIRIQPASADNLVPASGWSLLSGAIQFNPETRGLTVDAQKRQIAPVQARIFGRLVIAINSPVSYEDIKKSTWSDTRVHLITREVVQEHIRLIRKAINPYSPHLRTIHGFGYGFFEQAA